MGNKACFKNGYSYIRPKSFRTVKGVEHRPATPLVINCDICKKTSNNYYESLNTKTSTYGYICSECVRKLEAEDG